jgi:diacylglycerol kinase family enzyme
VGAAAVLVLATSTAYRVRRLARRPAAVGPLRLVEIDPNPTGEGLAVVVNADAGSADEAILQVVRQRLPAARVRLTEGEDLRDLLEAAAAAPGTRALGVAGGDGSINVAAGVAAARDLPLLAIPAGTLNHLARDLAVGSPEEAVQAVVEGTAVAVDLARIDGRPFVNAASFGSYAELVDARAALEDRIGKWPAVVVAGWRVLRRGAPIEVELDGDRRRLWMAFIGNCRYEPQGFAPSHRTRLDDGHLDVRWIDADQPFCRWRLVGGLLMGRLGRSAVYHEHTATSLRLRSTAGPLRLACDGETFDGHADVLVAKEGERVVLYRPRPPDPPSP